MPANESQTVAPGDTLAQDELSAYAAQELERTMSAGRSACKICNAESPLFDVVDFGRCCETPRFPHGLTTVPVYYRRCRNCGFVFTEFFDRFSASMWTRHVYNATYYSDIDPDYATFRPRLNARAVDELLCTDKAAWTGLDYGGGNGETAKLLRALGYTYDTHDPYGVQDVRAEHQGRFNFCSSFEVAEHTPNPRAFMADIIGLCSVERLAVLVGTHCSDAHVSDDSGLQWWYAAPRNGHISLYSRRSLQVLAERFSLQCFSISEQTHLFTRGYTAAQARRFLLAGKLRGRLRRMLAPTRSRS